MKVTIKQWHQVSTWHWKLPADDDLCGICRVSFDGTCPSCKYPGDDCPLVIGDCNHNFHMHCVLKWLETETSKGTCPMCRQVFRMKGGDVLSADNTNQSEINNVSQGSDAVMDALD
ncbi:hypothetical protein BABINDRAFT_41595 [Babjeviella inositovora NRRL Y-12698]|uniref:Anaphase-promoting complex subunit 11 n=1 Tax=Babjeviella inositovora NRRL Y-12698 TaxID=984486 RepID=A0A1E3QIE2_9ASCO|nr:uncharacterized protein BABINDRAFT_41595 [Babjeviella inositovora NRRL Y-12698]ODQ77459.1 hypothetical protein BABINDRAFT_41595 [Babjeviella inositovora NRRL Y-12698]